MKKLGIFKKVLIERIKFYRVFTPYGILAIYFKPLGAVHKLRKAERGGRGGQEILTFPYEEEEGS